MPANELSATEAALAHACDGYEHALVANDVEALMAYFWDSPKTVRYGATENLYGAAEINAFRKERPAGGLARRVLRREITALDERTGYCNLEFARGDDPETIFGRQTQFWRYFEDQGWRVVSAHVSLLATPTKD